MFRFPGFLTAVMAASFCFSPSSVEGQRPNVILIMADDLGYHDLSCYGSDRNETPHLEGLAGEGLRLTSFYAGAAVCSPSRMALLSGSYPARLGWRGGVLGYGMPRNSGLSRDVFTIAEAFQAAGYRTAMSGKWHVGIKDLLPMVQGFSSSYYIAASNNMSRDLFRDGELVQKDWDNRRLTETFTEEAIRVIEEDSDKPFFLYVPFSAPHFPAEAHPDWDGKSDNGAYGDVVEELDFRVGRILEALETAGIADQTIVVFTSDNGPEGLQRQFASALPCSGEKWMSREGGTRVPCIVRYPGVVPAGETSDAMVAAIDLFPTLAQACGIQIELPEGAQKLDGVNVWPSLTGEDAGQARTELLFWHGKGQATAFRQGDWKVYFGAGKGDPEIAGGPVLYNLEDDVAETRDVSARHPDRVRVMLERATELLADIHRNQLPIGIWKGTERPADEPDPEKQWGRWLR